jgi:hypothetical protein
MNRARIVLLLSVLALLPRAAAAQTAAPRLEVSGGILYLTAQELGEQNADLTRNQIGGEPFTLFQSETRIGAAPGFEARIGWRLTRAFAVEGGVLLSRPQLTARLSSDVEGIPDVTVEEDLALYIFDGAVSVHFGPAGGAVVPFVRGGVGYVRELHEGNALLETGLAYHAGGGATFWFGDRRRAGVRIDARLIVLDGGADLGNGARTVGAGGAAFVVAF